MKTAYGITGYLPARVAKALSAGKSEKSVDVRVERGSDDVLLRVQASQISEVRLGPSTKGETGVQLIFKKQPTVETVIRTQVPAGVRLFDDPILKRVGPGIGPVAIYI